MWVKRLTAGLLCVLLLLTMLPLSAVVSAKEKTIMDNYVVSQIYEKKALTATSGGYGNGWIKDLNIVTKDIAPENLALSLRFYFQNEEDPTDVSLLNAPSKDLKVATAVDGGKNLIWKMNAIKTATGGDLQPGVWNDILLPFSTGTGYGSFNFSTDILTFFWLEFGGLSPVPNCTVRMMDVAVVDTSRPAENTDEPEWDTTYAVGDIAYTASFTINGKGTATPTVSTGKSFTAVDASKHDPKKLQLLLDIDVENVTHPGDVAVLSQIAGQLELTSSGKNDTNEGAVGIQSLNWKSGKNEYAVNLSALTPTGGDLDYASINFMRIYMNNWPASFTDTLKITVSNVRLVDATDAASLPTLFSDGMVFQQKKPMALWGYQTVGTSVTAKLYKGEELLETKNATATDAGRWDLSFSAQPASYDAHKIVISSGDKVLKTISDVLIGEVWIASGQSNMALSVGTDMDAAAIVAAADNPHLRMYLEPTYPLGNTGEQPVDPAEDIPGAYWGYGDNGAQVSKASSVAYAFAKNLQKELNVPVGLIDASTGGTVIEAWLARTAIEGDAAVKKALKDRGLYNDEFFWPDSAGSMSTLYNQKIGPLEGMNIAGVIWYQGESNSNRSEIYDIELDLLKRSWGTAFGFTDGDMPLIFTQVAPYRYDNGATNSQHLGYLAMYMERGWALSADKNTAMLTIYDLPLMHMRDGVSSDPIHPRIKTPVGERFCASAMNMVYGGKAEYTAPVYKSMEIRDGAIFLTFDHVGDGLSLTGLNTALHGFTIAGADNVYVNAEAIVTDTNVVKVWNNRVADPKNVIYAFDNFNQGANLCNSSGIPASPFRTVALNDTTKTPDTSISYFTAQDWMTCDRDVWVYDTQNTENKSTGFRPSFTVSNGAGYTYDPYFCNEGIASLQVTHTGNTTVSPVLSYESLKQSFGKFNTLSVWILNPDKNDKTLSLTMKTTGNKVSTVPLTSGATSVTLKGLGDRFTLYTFDLSGLHTAMNSLASLSFNVTATGEGTLFFDEFSFGMTDAVVAEDKLSASAASLMYSEKDMQHLLVVEDAPYTQSSLKAFQDAKAAAEAVLANKDATPYELTRALRTALAAKDALVVMPSTDKSALKTALENVITDFTPYTAEAVEVYQKAVAAARAVYDNEQASQTEIDSAVQALTDAKNILCPPVSNLLGDVDGDMKLTTTDARMTLQFAADKIGKDALNTILAEVDGVAGISTTDARLILQFAAEKIDRFPVQDA